MSIRVKTFWVQSNFKKITKLQITLFQRKGIQYFTMKEDWQLVLQVICFVYKCEAMFSTQRLKISKCTWIKRLLETTFASSVMPTINLRKNNLNNACVTKNCHAKNRSRFTFNIIIIKNHEQPRRYMVHNYPLLKLSTAAEEHIYNVRHTKVKANLSWPAVSQICNLIFFPP